jgi:hypothetical protein
MNVELLLSVLHLQQGRIENKSVVVTSLRRQRRVPETQL